MRLPRFPILIVFIMVVIVYPLQAATRFWDGGGITNDWNNAFNWSTNVAPVVGAPPGTPPDSLVFPSVDAGAKSTNNNYAAGTDFAGLFFTEKAYTVAGNSFDLFSGGIALNYSGGNTSITPTIRLTGAGQSFDSGNSTSNLLTIAALNLNEEGLTLNGVGTIDIAGNILNSTTSVTLTKAESGSAILGGFNNFLGNIDVTGGTLYAEGFIAGTGNVTVSSGAVLAGNGEVDKPTTINGTLAPGTTADPTTTIEFKTLSFGAGTRTLSLNIDGTVAGDSHDEINIYSSGSISLNNAILDLDFGSYNPPFNTTFNLVDLTATATRTGSFSGISAGIPVLRDGQLLEFSYSGGTTGNDITARVVNQRPTATNLSFAESYTEDTAKNLTNIVVTDPDSNITATLTLSTPLAGSFNTATSGSVTSTYNSITGVWIASGAVVNVNTLLANLTFTPALNFNSNFTITTNISDGSTGPLSDSKTMTGSAVNDAPTLTTVSTLSGATEDTAFAISYATLAAAANEADVDSATLSFRIESVSNGTLTKDGIAVTPGSTILASGESLVWTPPLNANGTVNAFTIKAWDGLLASASAVQVPVTILGVNDAPTLANGSILNYSENQPAVAINNAITVGDVDNSTLSSATVTITANFASSEDVLGFTNSSMGNIIGSYNSGTGVMTLTSSGATATLAQWQSALRAVTYSNTSENPSTTSRSVNFVVNDGVANSNAIASTVNVAAVNDAPIATNLFVPNFYSSISASNLTDIVITDPDSIVTATLTLSSAGVGSFNTATAGTTTSSYNAVTGEWSASGPVAEVNVLLSNLTFLPSLGLTSSFTINVSVSDGMAPPVFGVKNMALGVPEIVVEHPAGTSLGDATSTIDFGNVVAGKIFQKVVLIKNTGSTTLTLGGFSFVGADASSFILNLNGTQFSIAPGGQTSFIVGFAPTSLGGRSTTLFISNNDADENPFEISLAGTAAAATLIPFDLVGSAMSGLSCLNMNPPVTFFSTGDELGDGIIFDTVTKKLSINVGWGSGNGFFSLSSQVFAAHIHGPTENANGNDGVGDWRQNAGILISLQSQPDIGINTSASNGGIVGMSQAFNATDEAALMDGKLYLDVHTATFPGGEMRGFLTPDADSTGPTAGTMTLSPPSPLAPGTAMTVNFSGWTDLSPPLIYSLYIDDILVGAQNGTTAKNITAPMSSGVHTLRGHVQDSLGNFTEVSQTFVVNVAPIATNLSAPELYIIGGPYLLTSILVTDSDSGSVTVSLALSNPSAGSLSTGTSSAVTSSFNPITGVWSASGAVADINFLLANTWFTPAPGFSATFQINTSVSDGIAPALTGTKTMSSSNETLIYQQDFTTNDTSNWTINDPGLSDITVDFFYDYSQIGVPSAPGGSGTRGLKMSANNVGAFFSGFSVSPNNQNFTGNYVLSFDLWSNYIGPLGPGGNGTTQLSTYGIGTSGTVPVWPGANPKESIMFGNTLDGGSAFDFRAYSTVAPIGYAAGSTVYFAPDRETNNSAAYYTYFPSASAPTAQLALFPGQTGSTDVGETAFRWVRVEIIVEDGFVTFVMDGLPIAQIALSTVTLGGGNIFFGHSDVNAGSSNNPNDVLLNVTLIDNITVYQVEKAPSPIKAWRFAHFGVTTSTGIAADYFDFDKDGIVNLLEFAFGLNPTLPDAASMPQAQRVGNDLIYAFSTPLGVSGITYGAESSDTLAPNDWDPVPNSATLPNYEFKIPTVAADKYFLRLTVTSPAD